MRSKVIIPATQTVEKVDVLATIEPRDGPWLGDSGYGRRIQESFPDREGVAIPIANADKLPGHPRARAINLFRNDGVQSAAFNANFRARCVYGAGGIVNSFDADWLHGGQFNVVAESVRVDAVTYRPRSFAAFAEPADPIILGYTIGDGAANPSRPLTFTTTIETITTAPTSFAFPVPDFARAARPFIFAAGLGPPPATPTVEYFDSTLTLEDGTGPMFETLYSQELFASGIALPGWCERVRIAPVAGPATARVCVQFELGL